MTMDLTFIGLIIIIWAFYTIIPTILLSFLQWYLCGKNLRWGRVLPLISAVISILLALLLPFVCRFVFGYTFLLGIPLSLVLFNIPTLVYFLVYRARKLRNAENDLTRMKIDDLE